MAKFLEPPFPNPSRRSQRDGEVIPVTPSSQTQTQSLHDVDPPERIILSLPTIFRRPDRTSPRPKVVLVEESLEEFVTEDLKVERLNAIHGYLWMAGRPFNARPLSRQKMMGYEVLPTDQADLHLLKFSNKLLVKPLPEYILDYNFWTQYLCRDGVHQNACGFLVSYIWLICSPNDMKMAHKLDLVPSHVTWSRWKLLVADVVSKLDMDALKEVNMRYHYGELRLGRINSIYRVRHFHTHFVRGYLYGYNRYSVFFERNFAWLLGTFVYFSLVLSAMQVVSNLPPLNNNHSFQRAAYGFSVFTMSLVVFAIVLLLVFFSSVFFYNMVAAIRHSQRDRAYRKVHSPAKSKEIPHSVP